MKRAGVRGGRGAREGGQGPLDAPRLPAAELAELVLRGQQGDVEARNAALVELLPTIRGAVWQALRRLGLEWDLEEVSHEVLPDALRALETWQAGKGAGVRTWVSIRCHGAVRVLSESSRYRDGATGVSRQRVRSGVGERTWRQGDGQEVEGSEQAARACLDAACYHEWRGRERTAPGAILAAAMAVCPVEQRQFLRWYAEEGCSLQEIARRLDVHPTYVSLLFARIKRVIAPALEEFRRRPKSA